MEIKTLKGYLYCATAGEDSAEIVDENGLTLSVEAGQQAYFTATCEKITVASGAITLNIVRG